MRFAIPPISGGTLQAFRVLVGFALVVVIGRHDIIAVPVEAQRHYGTPDLAFLHPLAGSAAACQALRFATLTAAGLFLLGIRARLAYAAVVVGMVTIAWVTLERRSAHDLGLPLITMLGWLAVPWDMRGPQRSTQAGFALWWPGLTLGFAFFCAAFSKLQRSGLAWITSGAVRYHFVTDASSAPVPWGLWIASDETRSVYASFFAFAIEVTFIAVVFAPFRFRPMFGLAALALLLGFYLFQGVFWYAWWMLLLAFLPWHWLKRTAAPELAPRLTRAQQVAIGAVVMVQAIALAGGLDREPLLSRFPMYSTTYPSPQAFDREMAWRYTTLQGARADGADALALVSALSEDDRAALVALAEQETDLLPPHRFAAACANYRARAPWPAVLDIDLVRSRFDWEAGRFRPATPIQTGPVNLAVVCENATALGP